MMSQGGGGILGTYGASDSPFLLQERTGTQQLPECIQTHEGCDFAA